MRLTFFIVSTPGLEAITLAEVRELGYPKARLDEGGVVVSGTIRDLYRCNYLLRTASRIYLRLFNGPTHRFPDVTAAFSRIELSAFVDSTIPIHVSATSHASTLYHTGAIVDAARDGIAAQGFVTVTKRGEENGTAPVLISIRIVRNWCTVSIDTSGDPLYQRGYKDEVGAAPLRETLAAAILRAVEWNPTVPLIDPFCGAGTIPIEAALIARKMPPGAGRSFGFHRWPGLNRGAWASVVAEAESGMNSEEQVTTLISGSDIDPTVVGYAQRNAERAGVRDSVSFSVRDARDLRPAPGAFVITNPPFGDRLENRSSVKTLLSRFGGLLQERAVGSQFAILAPAGTTAPAAIGAPAAEKLTFLHGGKRVILFTGAVTSDPHTIE